LRRKMGFALSNVNSRRNERYLLIPRAMPWAIIIQAFSLRKKNASVEWRYITIK